MTLKSSSQIVIDADVYINDNITEDISAGDVRDRIKDIADSMLNKQDGGLVLQTETGYSTAITPSSDYSFATKKYVVDSLAGVSPVWGSITGTVTDQTDLITYLSTNYQPAGNYQPLATNLTSLSSLTYASTSFVKMTAAGTFALDTNTYASSSDLTAYAKLDGSNTPFTGDIRIEKTSPFFKLKNNAVGSLGRIEIETDSADIIFFNRSRTAIDATISKNSTGFYISNTLGTFRAGKNNAGGTFGNQYEATAGGTTLFSNIIYFSNQAGTSLSSFTSSTGNWNYTGTAQNLLTIANGIKIGNNTDSAATAGAGSIRYASSKLDFSEGSNWRNIVSVISTNTKVTAGAPYTNDGYIIVTINGTDYKLMTTA